MKSFGKFFTKLKVEEKKQEQKSDAKELLKRLRYLKERSDSRKSEIKKTKSKRQP